MSPSSGCDLARGSMRLESEEERMVTYIPIHKRGEVCFANTRSCMPQASITSPPPPLPPPPTAPHRSVDSDSLPAAPSPASPPSRADLPRTLPADQFRACDWRLAVLFVCDSRRRGHRRRNNTTCCPGGAGLLPVSRIGS